MRLFSILHAAILSILFLGMFGSSLADTIGSGQPFTALVETSAGILGTDENGIWLSTDNGASFSSVYDEPGELYKSLAASGTTVIAVGESGLVLRSTNSGLNWVKVDSSPGFVSELISVATNGNGLWLAVGDKFAAHLIRSNDDDESWTEITAPLGAFSLRTIAWQEDTQWILAGEGEFNNGIIYRSTDNGDSWQVLADDLDAPVNGVAINSSGVITVVGEGGLLLRGSTSTSFEAPDGDTPVSEDLLTVIATSSGSFIAGGEAGSLLTIDGNSVTNNSLVDGPDVTAILVLADDSLLISGDYTPPAAQERSEPFALQLSRDGVSGDFVLTVTETLTDRTYRIESSTNLQDWTEVVGSERAGNSGPQTWTFPADGSRLFWRAVEF
jgi:photosystem II stability/assembly factor-like uncharacterized protein